MGGFQEKFKFSDFNPIGKVYYIVVIYERGGQGRENY